MKDSSSDGDVLALKDMLLGVALRITGNRQEAEDIVQETLLRLLTQRSQLAAVSNLEAYATTVCRNLALDHRRKAERRVVSLDEARHDRADNSPSVVDRMTRDERIQAVEAIVGSLPEKQRQVFHLRDVEGLSYKDIATRMGISEADVKVTLFRARNAIREAITT